MSKKKVEAQPMVLRPKPSTDKPNSFVRATIKMLEARSEGWAAQNESRGREIQRYIAIIMALMDNQPTHVTAAALASVARGSKLDVSVNWDTGDLLLKVKPADPPQVEWALAE